MEFLDVDSGAICKVLSKLSARDLLNCAATCKTLSALATTGSFAVKLWQKHCDAALGESMTCTHSTAAGRNAGAPRFYMRLYGHSQTLDNFYWYGRGSLALLADSSIPAHVLQRAGHSAVVLGDGKVLISGGLTAWPTDNLELFVVDMRSWSMERLPTTGECPHNRFRHKSAVVQPPRRSTLWSQVQKAIGRAHDAAGGSFVSILGGRPVPQLGRDPGQDVLEVLWINASFTQGVWVFAKTTGQPPGMRWHHAAEAFDDGRKVVVVGGERRTSRGANLDTRHTAYILDITHLSWTAVAAEDPLAALLSRRSLACSCIRRSAATGHEQLVMVGGIQDNDLAPLQPFCLDLATMTWECDRTDQGWFCGEVPTRRQRCGCCRVTSDWLIVHGGCPHADLMSRSNLLNDIWCLHLPTLTWKQTPARVHSRPYSGVMQRAGHTLHGMLAFGGCVYEGHQLALVGSSDVLLLGTAEDYEEYIPALGT